MGHAHGIVDSDKCFVIDPITRTITNTSEKVKLIQFDHDSERFTFECPRMIEGHDMTLCNSVRVQYINLNKRTGEDSCGVYEVEDLAVDSEDSTVVKFSWLISRNATKFVGTLNFLIDFRCVSDDGTVAYAWHTDIFKGVTVSAGMNNDETIEEKYPDILEQWKNEIMAAIPEVAPQTVKKIESLDKTNMVTIRSLDSGSYIFYGYFKPYNGADATMMFSSDILVNIVKGKNDTQAQIFYPYNNMVQHLKITDSSYEKKNIYLDNVGIQSDWNQNGTNALDYVKNRPCYKITTVTNAWQELKSGQFGMTSADFSGDGLPQLFADAMEYGNAVKGKFTMSVTKTGADSPTYSGTFGDPVDSVLVNGKTSRVYTTTDGKFSMSEQIQNSGQYKLNLMESTMMGDVMYSAYVINMQMPSETTAFVPLEDGYIPDTIQRVGEDVILKSSTSGSTKKFKITVNDSGELSATETTDA